MDRHGADALRWFMLCSGLAVVGAARRAQGARRDRVQGDPHVLVGRVVPVALRPRQRLDAGHGLGDAQPTVLDRWALVPGVSRLAGDVDAAMENISTRRKAGRLLADVRSTTCRTGTCGARVDASGTVTRQLSRTLHRVPRDLDPAARAVHPVRHRARCGPRCSSATGVLRTRCISRRGPYTGDDPEMIDETARASRWRSCAGSSSSAGRRAPNRR